MKRTKQFLVFLLIVAGIIGLLALTAEHWLPLLDKIFQGRPVGFWNSLAVFVGVPAILIGGSWKVFTWIFSQPAPNTIALTPAHQVAPRHLEELYYADLLYDCQRYSLEDLDEEHSGGKLSLKLGDVYQDQFVRLPEEEEDEGKRREGHLLKNESIPLLQALEKLESGHVVIRGKVGSGKSSFINYLTAAIIHSHGRNRVDGLPDKLAGRPVIRILLRELGATVRSKTDHRGLLLTAIHSRIESHIRSEAKARHEEISTHPPQPFIHTFISRLQTNGVILLDGLDEVGLADHKRETVLKAIGDFLDNKETSAGTQLILTSRPHAYENHLSGFVRLEMEPMNVEQVGRFIRHWYAQVSRDRQFDRDDPDNRKRAADLIQQIKDRASLQVLAETPMLLTLLLGIDFANYRLPESRADLYDRAVKLLLQRWHRNLQTYRDALQPEERATLEILTEHTESTVNLRRALCHLAFESYKDADSGSAESGEPIVFREAQVLGHLTRAYGQSVDAEAVRYFLQYRTNLLVAGGDETLQFAHKSFHEFLAAEAFQYRRQGNDALRALMNDPQKRDWWREVLLFRMNMMKAGELADFISRSVMTKLESVGDEELENHAGVIALCAQAAVEAKLEDHALQAFDQDMPALYRALQEKLQRLMQREQVQVTRRAECGYLLGRLGDYRKGAGVVRNKEGSPLLIANGTSKHALPDIEWINMPAGRLHMGSSDDDQDAYDWEKPALEVDVKPFCISRFPVTNAQYACFIEAGGYDNEHYWLNPASARRWWRGKPGETTDLSLLDDDPDWKKSYEKWLSGETTRRLPWFWDESRWNNPNHPVVGVSWYEALAFCNWLNECLQQDSIPTERRTSGRPRLPSEDEWEYAARGDQGLKYAWGNEADRSKGNYRGTGLERTTAVGLFPAGRAFDGGTNLCDMSGNVWEWTLSRWGTSISKPDFTYTNWTSDQAECNKLDPVELRIIRGGSWNFTSSYVRCAMRYGFHPDLRDDNVGFRVVFSLAADS